MMGQLIHHPITTPAAAPSAPPSARPEPSAIAMPITMPIPLEIAMKMPSGSPDLFARVRITTASWHHDLRPPDDHCSRPRGPIRCQHPTTRCRHHESSTRASRDPVRSSGFRIHGLGGWARGRSEDRCAGLEAQPGAERSSALGRQSRVGRPGSATSVGSLRLRQPIGGGLARSRCQPADHRR